jgi:hypothetical protein
MAYIDKNLLPNELIVFRTRKSVIVFMAPVILVMFTLILTSNFHFIANMNRAPLALH